MVDTGGFVPGAGGRARRSEVRAQAELAVEEADVVLLVVGRSRRADRRRRGRSPRLLRRTGKPLLLVVNKLDSRGRRGQRDPADFYRLGIRDVFPVSAEHAPGHGRAAGRGAARPPQPPKRPEGEDSEQAARRRHRSALTILGRPNVGKSTLVNALVSEERVVASQVPGTTRDPIDTDPDAQGPKLVLTDTAGIRAQGRSARGWRSTRVLAALRSIERSDVAVLVLDATEPAVDQDARLAGLVEEKGRALLVVVNKWDLVHGPAHGRRRSSARS